MPPSSVTHVGGWHPARAQLSRPRRLLRRDVDARGPKDTLGEHAEAIRDDGPACRCSPRRPISSPQVSIRAVPTSNAPVEVLKLSRADFEAGFMFENQKPGAPHAQHDAARTTTLRRRASVVPSASTSEVRSDCLPLIASLISSRNQSEVRSRRALSPSECL